MIEHEQLKQICDKIGYEIHKDIFLCEYGYLNKEHDCGISEVINIREIIFTQEFMDKYIEYYQMQGGQKIASDIGGILVTCKLNNPIQYLYNLLELGK